MNVRSCDDAASWQATVAFESGAGAPFARLVGSCATQSCL
jgi:hypothetical protein